MATKRARGRARGGARGQKRGIVSVAGLADALPSGSLDGLINALPTTDRRSGRLRKIRAEKGAPVYAENYPSRSPSGSKPKVPAKKRATKRAHNRVSGWTKMPKKWTRRKPPSPRYYGPNLYADNFGQQHVQGAQMITVNELANKLAELNIVERD